MKKIETIIQIIVLFLCIPASAVISIAIPILLFVCDNENAAIGWLNVGAVLGIIILAYFVWEFIYVFFIEKEGK